MGNQGPAGQTGPAGPGLETGLVQIIALSWVHGGNLQFTKLLPFKYTDPTGKSGESIGLVIAFSDEVQMPSASNAPRIFQVLIDPQSRNDLLIGFENLCAITGIIIPVTVTAIVGNLVTAAHLTPGSPTSTKALAFVFDSLDRFYTTSITNSDAGNLDVWVRLRGDFLLDTGNPAAVPPVPPRAISAEFVRAQFPTGERPAGSGLCLEGGTFESWFEMMH
jgi:hypothetical protein